jgi:hypothetical protein
MLLHAASDHVLHVGGVDPRARHDFRVAAPEQLVGVDVLVIALFLVPAPDRGADGFDDYYFTAV